MPTVGETIAQVREMEGRAAVKRALAGYLRMRYVSRDSAAAVAQVRGPDGSAVSEEVIETEARSLEAEAKEIEQAVKAAKTVEVSDE